MATKCLVILLLLLVSVTIATRPDLVLNDVKVAVGTHLNYPIGDEKFLAIYRIHRIVQRGHKTLPDWLKFDSDSSQLSGVPEDEDVGLYAIRLKASCLDPATQNCQDKISRTFHITVVKSLDNEPDLGSTHSDHWIVSIFSPTRSSSLSIQHRMNQSTFSQLPVFRVHPSVMLQVEPTTVMLPVDVTTASSFLTYMHVPSSLSSSYSMLLSTKVHEIPSQSHPFDGLPVDLHDVSLSSPCDTNSASVFASLVLHVPTGLTYQSHNILIDRWSSFISKDPRHIMILAADYGLLSLQQNRRFIITAGPGNVIESMSESVELSWHIACDSFEHIQDFVRVLQHNVEVGRITEEIGYNIIAWMVYSDRKISRREKRNANMRGRQTGTPSMTLPSEPTSASSDFSSTTMSSPHQSSPSSLPGTMPSVSSLSSVSLPFSYTLNPTASVISPSSVASASTYFEFSSTFSSSFASSLEISKSSISLLTRYVPYTRLMTFTSTTLLSSFTLFTSETVSQIPSGQSTNTPTLSVISRVSFTSSLSTLPVSAESSSNLQATSYFNYTSIISPSPTVKLSSGFLMSSSSQTVLLSPLLTSSSSISPTLLNSSDVSFISSTQTFSMGVVTVSSTSVESYFPTSSGRYEDISPSFTSHFSVINQSEISSISLFYSSSKISKSGQISDHVSTSELFSHNFSESSSSVTYRFTTVHSAVPTSSFYPMTFFTSTSQLSNTSKLSGFDSSSLISDTVRYKSLVTISSSLVFSSVIFTSAFSSLPTVNTKSSTPVASSSQTLSSPLYQSASSTSVASSSQTLSSPLYQSASSTLVASSSQTLSSPLYQSASSTSVASSSQTLSSPLYQSASSTSVASSSQTLSSPLYQSASSTSVASSSQTVSSPFKPSASSTPVASSSQTLSSPFKPSASSTPVASSSQTSSSPFKPSASSTPVASSSQTSSSPFKPSASSTPVASSSQTSSSPFNPSAASTSSALNPNSSSPLSYSSSLISSSISLHRTTSSLKLLSSSLSEFDISTSSVLLSSSVAPSFSYLTSLSLVSHSSMFSFSPPASTIVYFGSFSYSEYNSLSSHFTTIISPFTLFPSFSLSKSSDFTLQSSLTLFSVDLNSSSVSSTLSFISFPLSSDPLSPESVSKPSSFSVSLFTTIFSLVSVTSSPITSLVTPPFFSSSRSSAVDAVMTSMPTEFGPTSTLVFQTSSVVPVIDDPPSLQQSIDLLEVMVGRYFEYMIPADTFNDTEDGDTRSLSLSISLLYGKPLPNNSWLMFDPTEQKLYGIPLKQDVDSLNPDAVIQKITLIAKDSQGQTERDVISLKYLFEVETTHRISLVFNYSFDSFQSSRSNLVNVAQRLGSFYGTNEINSLTFLSVTPGSTIVNWGNHSMFGDVCALTDIKEMFDRLVYENDTVVPEVVYLFPEYNLTEVRLELDGLCLIPITTKAAVVEEQENKMWIEIIMPALVVILIIVIIALILLICCRHRRPSKEKSQDAKPSFLEDRRPIIFPEELEMVDPSLKPHGPLILPADYLSETPPAVPPHGQLSPPTYNLPDMDDCMLSPENSGAPLPPRYGSTLVSDPPPYRLPPPYYNPHRALT